jgi:hypothetical protein
MAHKFTFIGEDFRYGTIALSILLCGLLMIGLRKQIMQ